MDPEDRAELERWALQVRCPTCGRQPGVPCWAGTLWGQRPPHPSRVALGAAS